MVYLLRELYEKVNHRKVYNMKTNKYILTLLATTLVCSSILLGCKQESNETIPTVEEIPIETVESSSSEITPETAPDISETDATELPPASTEVEEIESTQEFTEINTVPITFTIINTCGADIGMFSVIDPVTAEQVNVGAILNEEMLSLESDWPIGVTDFQWAVYNMNGELYSEATTDISQAITTVIITLQGEGSIDKINTSFQ